MGAWGTGSFDNDDAMDFVGELRKKQISDIAAVMSEVIEQHGYLEAPSCSVAIAAAETVAAAKGAPASDAPPDLLAWAKKNKAEVNADLIASALKAVSRIRADSELKELWEEGNATNEWHEHLDALAKRLGG